MSVTADPDTCHHAPAYTPARGVWCPRCGCEWVPKAEADAKAAALLRLGERLRACAGERADAAPQDQEG